jgi:hypothetical protein
MVFKRKRKKKMKMKIRRVVQLHSYTRCCRSARIGLMVEELLESSGAGKIST